MTHFAKLTKNVDLWQRNEMKDLQIPEMQTKDRNWWKVGL